MADYVLSAKGTYDGSDFDSGIEGSRSKLSGFMETAKSIGEKVKSAIGDGIVKAADGVTSAVGTIGAAVATLAVQGGISRALNIEQAQFKMRQMGMDVDSVMESVKTSVKGTAFGLDAAATSASILGTSGVQAGEEMTRALQSSAGVASIAGSSMEDIASIFSKVATKGKLTGDELLQLNERGINASDALAKALGKTQDEVRDMVTKGKIDFKTFSDAMYQTFGEAAYGANETFSGAMANTRAALSRVGEAFASPALGALKEVFKALIPTIDAANAALQPLAETFKRFMEGVTPKLVSGIESLREKIEGLGEGGFKNLSIGAKIAAAAVALLSVGSMGGLISQIPVVGGALGGLFGLLGKLSTPVGSLAGLFGSLSGSLGATAATLSGPVVAAIAAVIALVASMVAAFGYLMATNEGFRSTIAGLVSDIGSALAPAFQSLAGLLPGVQGLFASVVSVVRQLAPAILGLVAAIAPVVSTLVSSLVPVLNLVMGVIGSLLEQIAAFVAPAIEAVSALISAHMPQMQSIIESTMAAIQAVIETVWPYVQERITATMAVISAVIQTVWPVIEEYVTAAMNAIQAVITTVMALIQGDWEGVWNGILAIGSAIWEGIKSMVSAAIGAVRSNISNVLNAIKSLWDSIWNAIRSVLSTVWNAMKAVVAGAAAAISSAISSALSAISNVWRSAWSSVSSFLSSTWANMKSAAKSGVDGVVNVVRGIRGRIVGFFAGAGSWLVGAGQSIINGLVSGIQSAIGGAVSAVSGAVGRIRSLFPFSPAKIGPFSGRGWVLYSGMSIMDALAKGADVRSRRTVEAFGNITERVRDALDMGSLTFGLSPVLAPELPAASFGNLTIDGPTSGDSIVAGDVTNIGDVSLDVSDLEGLATLEDFVALLKRAKRSNPSRVRR